MRKKNSFIQISEYTAVQTVPGTGPNLQLGSFELVTRSGDGKQIGFTHRLKDNGVASFNKDKSFFISVLIEIAN